MDEEKKYTPVEEFMNALDSNHDGKVSREEYNAFVETMSQMFENVKF